MRTNLPTTAWGHAILHAASLVRLRPTSYHKYSPLQLVNGQEPNISHLKIFGCAVYVPISPPQRTKMGPQRRLGVYIGFDSPSIIKYLEPKTGDLFTARFADCQFDETVFPALGGDKTKFEKEKQEICGMQYPCLIMILVQINVNLKFKRLSTYKKSQIDCLMHLLMSKM